MTSNSVLKEGLILGVTRSMRNESNTIWTKGQLVGAIARGALAGLLGCLLAYALVTSFDYLLLFWDTMLFSFFCIHGVFAGAAIEWYRSRERITTKQLPSFFRM
jgi:uncharacterized membrane protein